MKNSISGNPPSRAIPPIAPSIDRIATCCRTYTNETKAFAIFAGGTVVIADSIKHDSQDDYLRVLKSASVSAPSFTVLPMNDGNYLVRFAPRMLGLVFNDQYTDNTAQIHSYVDQFATGPSEIILLPSTDLDSIRNRYVGLLARAWMQIDLSRPQIVKLWPSEKSIP